jgi:hypothetical protein
MPTRTATPASAGSGSKGAPQPGSRVKKNSLPRPGVLPTRTSPPISATRRRQIASPNPVPPYLRVDEVSAWAKA